MTEAVTVRLGPGLPYGVRGELTAGEVVAVTAAALRGEWVAVPGQGWLQNDPGRLQLNGDVSALPAPSSVYYDLVGPSHPSAVRTGNAEVDRLIDVVGAGDLAELTRMVRVSSVVCPAEIGIGTFACPPGVADGSSISVVLSASGCEVTYALADEQDRVAREWFSDARIGEPWSTADMAPALYAAFQNEERTSVVFAFSSGVGAVAQVHPDGSVDLVSNVCERWPANLLVRSRNADGVDYLLPPATSATRRGE